MMVEVHQGAGDVLLKRMGDIAWIHGDVLR